MIAAPTTQVYDTPMERPADFLARTNDPRTIVLPEPRELFIDLDGLEARSTFEDRLEQLQRYCPAVVTRDTPSRTPGHAHVVIKFDRDLDPVLRIALQACLGSDRKHEMFSLLRVLLNTRCPPTLFFESMEEEDGKEIN